MYGQHPQDPQQPQYQQPPHYASPVQQVTVNNSGSVWKIVMALFIFFVVIPMVLMLSFCVACTAGTGAVITELENDRVRTEPSHLASSLRNRLRVALVKSGETPATLSSIAVTEKERTGMYWLAEDGVRALPHNHAALVFVPTGGRADKLCLAVFSLEGGEVTLHWHDTRSALEDGYNEQKKALEATKANASE